MKEVSLMCNLSQGVEARGIQKGLEQGMKQGMKKGMKQGTLVSIQNLMESMGWTAEEAMTALRIPEADRSDYLARLRQ